MTGRAGRIVAASVAGILVVAGLLPFFWALAGSVSPEADLFAGRSLLPAHPVAVHYEALFAERAFWRPLLNSLIVSLATTVLCLVLGSFCAYAMARMRFPGRKTLLFFILAVAMFPQISIVSPLFLLLRAVGLIDTYPGLILPYMTFAMPLTIWLLTGFFRQIPPEVEQAAMVDGAGRLRTLWEIVLPLSMPALVTTGILTFLYCWNEFLFALSFMVSPEKHTVPVAIALFRGRYQVPWGQVLAATVVTTLPVVLLVLLFQRRIVRGLTSGAVKG